MRKAWILLLAALSGCDPLQTTSDKPTLFVINQIESKLRSVKCIAPLTKWERSYWYSRDGNGDINHNSVEIDFRQAGFEEFKHGRYVLEAPPIRQFDVDDRDYQIVFGSFNVSKKRLSLQACGRNIS
ncbi:MULTISPECIES: hypothetical protein [Sphingomonas]|uniref:hypothetical protein n=1 Tax=Sphingomonas TaxID=13687 RepID=UPI001144FC1C|nr:MULTISPECIES: hypothetical protein [Sphingomonas]